MYNIYNDIAGTKSNNLTDIEKNELWAYIYKNYPEDNVKVRSELYRRTIRRLQTLSEKKEV